jgi:hypothetical protein
MKESSNPFAFNSLTKIVSSQGEKKIDLFVLFILCFYLFFTVVVFIRSFYSLFACIPHSYFTLFPIFILFYLIALCDAIFYWYLISSTPRSLAHLQLILDIIFNH